MIGAGDVGGAVLRHLAGAGEFGELWALDIDLERASGAVHDAAAIASYTRQAPSPHAAAVDVLDVDELATTLASIAPDVIVQTATLQSWWVITQLRRDLWTRLEREARFGPWLPFHLVPAASVAAAAAAQLGDGIARIDARGEVTFTEPAAVAMHDILGYDCRVLEPEDARDRVVELRRRLATLTAT